MKHLMIFCAVISIIFCGGIAWAEKATLTWTNNATNAAANDIERKGGLCASTNTFEVLASVGPTIAMYEDLTIVTGNAYCYRVAARNAGGKAYSNLAELPPLVLAPAAPSQAGATRQP